MAPAQVATASWINLQQVSMKWMYEPDFLALRACLATVKGLDVDTTPIWLMLIGASGTGKTAYYMRCCESYPRYELTDEMSTAGLSSGKAGNWGDGLLKRLGTRGLWLMPDFTVFLNMREERRNEVMGIQRRLFDGKYDRVAAGERLHWSGRLHVVAACTNALERFYRVNADLGERFIQVRIERRDASDELIRKADAQRRHWQVFQDEIQEAAKAHIESTTELPPVMPFEIERKIMGWADFVSQGRISTHYNYKDELVSVGHQEGSSRLHQQFTGMAVADAWLFGQDAASNFQVGLIERIAMDCLPWARRAILQWFRTDDSLPLADVQEMSAITHPVTFRKAIEELVAIGALILETSGSMTPEWNWQRSRVRLSPPLKKLLC